MSAASKACQQQAKHVRSVYSSCRCNRVLIPPGSPLYAFFMNIKRRSLSLAADMLYGSRPGARSGSDPTGIISRPVFLYLLIGCRGDEGGVGQRHTDADVRLQEPLGTVETLRRQLVVAEGAQQLCSKVGTLSVVN